MGNCAHSRSCNASVPGCPETPCRGHSSPSGTADRPAPRLAWLGSAEPGGAGPARDPRLANAELSGLSKVVECCQPLLFEIVGFLAQSPNDVALLCGMSARFVSIQMRPVANSIWKDLYAQKWPSFHDCFSYQGFQDWCHLYRETLSGRVECTLEVFDREKKPGFAMAAMPARLQYEARCHAYVARYMSATELPPEKIQVGEEHRLRFCPESARGQLLNGHPLASVSSDAKACEADPQCDAKAAGDSGMHSYPYRVLQGVEGLRVGAGVELQWRMQEGSPFGWWYGQLDALTMVSDGLAQATITFRHFPASSRWYRLDVVFGDSRMRECSFGGYTGGIRSVSEAETRQCMKFFPKELVVF